MVGALPATGKHEKIGLRVWKNFVADGMKNTKKLKT
jgi:hypothetical protein